MTRNKIENLVFISQQVGKSSAYAQGGGGNTSIKLDKKTMAIKSSGRLLREMSRTSGYSIVDYNAICDYLKHPDVDENTFIHTIKSFVLQKNNRPSIETSFHAQLGQCVIHTHSIYANILNCSEEGKVLVTKLFPDALWVDYATPGRELTLAIQKILTKTNLKSSTIFLQNHGLIVAADTAHNTLALHKTVNQKIIDYFKLSKKIFTTANNSIQLDFIKNHVLFPDQVVYTSAEAGMLNTVAAKETLWAYNFILNTIIKKDLTPCFIPKEKTDMLLNMESEKYRQEILKK